MNTAERICILTCVFLSSMLSFGIAELANQYRAEASFTFTLPDNEDPIQSEGFVLANLPNDEPSISLQQVRNTTLFVLSVTAEKPEDAASRANKAVGILEQRLRRVAPEAEFKFMQKAEPPQPAETQSARTYPQKTNIVCAVFSLGDKGSGNGASAWDPEWQKHYGGFDDPAPSARRAFQPKAFDPGLNPFYVALPYNDVEDGRTKPEARQVVPWFRSTFEREGVSVCKDRWIAIQKGDRICYAQWSDCGPHRSEHWQYVFGNERPAPNPSLGAGILVSPAVRDYLGLSSKDLINWRFIEFGDVPQGPWAKFGKNNPFVREASR